MRKIVKFFVLAVVVFLTASLFRAEDYNPKMAVRAARSDGEGRTQVSVQVGSTTPVSPFASLSTGGGSPTKVSTGPARGFLSNAITGQLDELRRISLTNETSYYIHLG